jgi:hypothetical protein
LDQWGGTAFVDLASQAADVHVHHIGQGVFVEPPDAGQNALAAEQATRRTHQQLQQCQLARRQVQSLTCPIGPHAFTVQHHIGDPQLRLALHLQAMRTSAEGLQAGQQLFKFKGFTQVVVCTHFQTGDALFQRAQRREHQDGKRHTLAAQGLANVHAVHARQHPVEHHYRADLGF